VTFTGVNGGNPFFTSAGSIGLGPNFGSVDGVKTPFLYCVELFTDINVPGTYLADLSNNGVVHGGLLANAGSIAWLVDNIGPTALSSDAQEGLQAAIWKQVYGPLFNVAPTSAGTGAGILAAYNADIAALGSKTAALSDVLWISPYNSNGTEAQGLVTRATSATPEPATIVTAALGLIGGFVMLRRRQKTKLTA
jgi:hypothetical protein